MKHRILVTGATGYVGVNLVSKLLNQVNVEQILCTTRHKSPAAFWSALESNLKEFELPVNTSILKSKIQPVEIDLVKDRHSLLNILEPFNKTITAVHHLACETNYAVVADAYKPWEDITRKFVDYCMDPTYPKELHATGSYGQYLVDFKHNNEDFYWINSYFQYKKWLHFFLKEKFAQGLKGVLFEPGYITGPKDPGQLYMFWRIVRLFAALRHAFPYKMVITPIDMLIEHYWIALDNPGKGPNILCPFIKDVVHMYLAVQEMIPDTQVIDYEKFRQLVQLVVPKRAKYFGPNMMSCIEGVQSKYQALLHPLYDYSKYENINLTEYLLTCKSFPEALQLGQEDRNTVMKVNPQQKV